jgi:hypothetical protein
MLNIKMEKLEKKINKLIIQCKNESNKPDSFSFLPEITATLKLINEIISTGVGHPRFGKNEREKIVRGLGRLVTEQVSFSESRLGERILLACEEFVNQNI